MPDGVNQLLGTVRDVSYLGVSTSYIVETRGGGSVTVYEQNVQRATRAELWEPGEEVRLVWSPTHTFAVEAGGEPPPDLPVGRPLVAAGRGARAAATDRDLAPEVRGRRGDRGRGRRVRGLPRLDRRAAARQAGAVEQRGARLEPPRRRSRRRLRRPGRRPPPPPSEPIASLPPATGTLRFANWEGYMDIDEATNTFPTLERFTKETGIKVDYVEAIDGNETFFTSQPGRTARSWPPDGVGPHRHDRLDDRPAHPARLAGNARSDAELPGQPPDDLPRALVRPEHEPGRAATSRG